VSEVIDAEVIEEETSHLPAVRAHEAMVTRAEVTVPEVVAQRDKVKAVMEAVMIDGAHYGRIPGISKPTLFKPGAEVLATTFRLAPSYKSERMFDESGHLTVVAKCILTHAPSGMVLGEGEGLCSSREEKYAYRKQGRVCPACGAEAVIKGKQEYGGGWLCWKKAEPVAGCGAKFPDGDKTIEDQVVGKVPNEQLADTWNTVLKMADKRALVAAVLNCTAASDIFTQDVEDTAAASAAEPPTPAEEMPPPSASPRRASGSKLEKMRKRIMELSVAADEQRGEQKTAGEIQATIKSNWAVDELDNLDEGQLGILGTDLKQWLDGGCKGHFSIIPF
jgi:hypothetical protein